MSEETANTPLSILLVEDHPEVSRILETFLTEEGYHVTTAGSVSDAVKCVVGQNFDLIVSDVGLPDGNGVSLLHGIRAFCKTPAIALTAYGSEQDVERCLKAGFALHLTKPAGADDLRRAIREALDSAEKAAA